MNRNRLAVVAALLGCVAYALTPPTYSASTVVASNVATDPLPDAGDGNVGMSLGSVGSFSVQVCATASDAGFTQTLAGGGVVKFFIKDSYSGLWGEAVSLQRNVTSTQQCQPLDTFRVGVPNAGNRILPRLYGVTTSNADGVTVKIQSCIAASLQAGGCQ